MKRFNPSFTLQQAGALMLARAVCLAACLTPCTAVAAINAHAQPSFVITDDPVPVSLQSKIYNKPSVAPVINPSDVMSPTYYDEKGETPVGNKVDSLKKELSDLQGKVAAMAGTLAHIENAGQSQAAAYYASVATISTQLQSGTTPGNPRLLQKLQTARSNLEQFGGNVQTLNDLSLQIASASSHASYLLETVRATYSLSGAIEEDHVRLAQMEDSINDTNVIIERLLNNVNDDITRTTGYLETERDNLRTLSLAIQSGNMFSKSLSNRPFSNAQLASFSGNGNGMEPPAGPSDLMPVTSMSGMPRSSMGNGPMTPPPAPAASPGGVRPLVKIRFDRPDVDYQQPLYMAVNEALKRYPDVRFELVAVHPTKGNAAQVAIESTQARRDAEKVLRSLTQMGLDLDRIDLSYTASADATGSEVHLYIH